MKDLLVCCMYDQPATWTPLEVRHNKQCNPGSLRNHSLCSYKSNLILVGGQKNVVDNNSSIYRFDLLSNSWSICKCFDQQSKPFNFALDSHSAIVHSTPSSILEAHLYLIGGFEANSTLYSNQIIKIELQKASENNLTFKTIKWENGPSPRGSPSCCLVNN